MRIFKRILVGLAALIILLLIVTAFSANEYTVRREVVINRPKQEVFNYVKLLKNHDNYNKWVMADPAMKKEFRNTDGTPGFIYAWESKNDEVGKGEQEIMQIAEGDRIDIQLRFIKPFEGKSDTYMATEVLSPTQTKVSWQFHSKMPYPMNGMLLVMDFDKLLGDTMNESLNNLKNVLEK